MDTLQSLLGIGTMPSIKVTKTDRLKMQYVVLPTIDLSMRFLYKFTLPIETVWQEGKLSFFRDFKKEDGQIVQFSSKESLEQFALREWNSLITENMRIAKTDIPEAARWLQEMEGADLVECEITPKQS